MQIQNSNAIKTVGHGCVGDYLIKLTLEQKLNMHKLKWSLFDCKLQP